jgi:toxin-antitoxin system PIN domain toxin
VPSPVKGDGTRFAFGNPLPNLTSICHAGRHEEYHAWIQDLIDGPQPYAVSDFAMTGVVRIITNRRIYQEDAATTEEALAFATAIREQPHAIVLHPGPRFWSIFTDLCLRHSASGRLVPDVALAALAIEHGCEVVTEDRDFAKFTDVRSRSALN